MFQAVNYSAGIMFNRAWNRFSEKGAGSLQHRSEYRYDLTNRTPESSSSMVSVDIMKI